MYKDEEWVARWLGEMNRLMQEIEDANFHSSTVHLHTHPSVPEEDEMDFVVERRAYRSDRGRVYMEQILIERCEETRVEPGVG